MTRPFRHAFICYFLLIFCPANAQKLFGNEWINPGQTYYKIPVGQNGLYQITASELKAAGIPIHTISSSSIQIFRRGQELAIEVSPDSAGKMGNNGYIHFYGKKNDGAADSVLYVTSAAMPHPYYSLYSDTAAYFLTWRVDGLAGKRIKPETSPDSLGYHFKENIQLCTSHYLPGTFYPPESNFKTGSVLTDYDFGEGWTGPELKEKETFDFKICTENALISAFGKSQIELILAGWAAGKHRYEVWIGSKTDLKRKIADVEFYNYDTFKLNAALHVEDLGASGNVPISLVPIETGGHISVSCIKIIYPQKPNKSVELIKVKEMRLVKFDKTIPTKTNYLIISHPLMHIARNGLDPVKEYAEYRSSAAGGNYQVLVKNIDEVYDEFNYGDRSPAAIRNILFWMKQNTNLQLVLLIGRSIDPQKVRKLDSSGEVDMIPNAGWPGSDIALAMLPGDGSQNAPIVSVGRINALNSQNVLDYLAKVKAVEAEPISAPWRRNVLHLSGGRSRDELALFKNYVRDFQEKLAASQIGLTVQTISKRSDDFVEQVDIHNPVNQGVSLITLFGHSSLDVTDIDIGNSSDAARLYRNHPRYPAVIVNGCASGSIFYSTKTMSSDWVFTPNAGAVLFLAHTFNGNSLALKRYTSIFYEVIADSNFSAKPFGLIQQEAIRRNLRQNPDIFDRITIQQMNLHGDPAIRIFPKKFSEKDPNPENPDRISPLLSVQVDGRQLANYEAVSAKPSIQIEISDASILENDTSVVVIWIKQKCEGCADKCIYLKNAFWKEAVKGHLNFEINLPEPLTVGSYLLTVQASDLHRNIAPLYQINFRVTEFRQILRAEVSPNPSDKWFKISIEMEGEAKTDVANLVIFSTSGKVVHQERITLHTGINQWFWNPINLPSGIYLYNLTFSAADLTISPTAKKTMRGRLIRSD